jgi:hypothetical protein
VSRSKHEAQAAALAHVRAYHNTERQTSVKVCRGHWQAPQGGGVQHKTHPPTVAADLERSSCGFGALRGVATGRAWLQRELVAAVGVPVVTK